MKKPLLLLILLILAIGLWIATAKPNIGIRFLEETMPNLTVWNTLDINFNNITSDLNEEKVIQKFQDVKLKCMREGTEMGDRVCWAYIRKANGIPAKLAAFFFIENKIFQIKIDVKGEEHTRLLNQLKDDYGEWEFMTNQPGPYGSPIAAWFLPSGTLSVSETVPAGVDSQILWVSNSAMEKSISSHSAARSFIKN